MKKFIITAIVALFVSAGFAQPAHNVGSEAMAAFITEASQAGWLQIGPDDAFDFIEQVEPFVLDVRSPTEFEAGHIEFAVNIPLAELDGRIAELPQSLDAPMIVYCAVGIRGNFGLVYLKMLGYTNVRNINGGSGAWANAGLPLVQ